MKLYIQIKEGQPYEHPIVEENLIAAFPHIDLDNLPPEFAPFERVENPKLANIYQIDVCSYQWVGNIVKDVWTVQEKNSEEQIEIRAKLRQTVIDSWNALPQRENFTAWIFNEITFQYEPPIPRPTTGQYIWHGATSTWVEPPQYPDDGKEYILDFASITWVEINL